MNEKKREITNTAAEASTREGAEAILMEAMLFGGGPGAIEAMEARGQRELCASGARLPTQFGGGLYEEEAKAARAALEKAGVKFGKAVDGDPLFCEVELPAGWKIEGTDHAMWSKLLDEHGRERASIFYKAAFYDRKASIHVEQRFKAFYVYADEASSPSDYFPVATDGGKEIWRGERVSHTEHGTGAYRVATERSRAWLDANQPGWDSLEACW